MPRRVPVAEDDASVEKLLDDARGYVERMPPTPGSRELKARLDQYRRVVDGWAMRTPTDEQRAALRDQVVAVLGIAKTSAPTMKVRRPPETE